MHYAVLHHVIPHNRKPSSPGWISLCIEATLNFLCHISVRFVFQPANNPLKVFFLLLVLVVNLYKADFQTGVFKMIDNPDA
ncbi:hypothetical protein DRQ21_11330 [Candidatus Fermentibacteria bacterium]|nr:MAG: hypothetical protein DRQ21_11330 [Candidatus Fermentibacteria bacterium]